jgi:predicted nucleotidyltransferase
MNENSYGFSERTMSTLASIFRSFSGIEKIILYGSRAMGRYREGSDIDITVCSRGGFTHTDLLRLAGAFDDSDIPYLVDVSIYDDLRNEELKAHIRRVGKVLYVKNG